jgi:uncharacterized protein YdhG (YjbR/CyaY superfamily)
MAKNETTTQRTTKKAKARGAVASPSTKARASKSAPAKKTSPSKSLGGGTPKPTTIDDYLARVDGDTRVLLQALRKTIHDLVPDVTECISYSMPAFRYQGKVVAGFLATKAGASYFPFSGTTLETLARELQGYSRTKSGLHFTQQKPLPRSLIHTLLRARIAEL